ncbi:MAG: glycoside hydrolase family 44 protein, partial [Myxococcota bacterium]
MMLSVLALTMGVAFGADELVYGEALSPNWYNWSWSSEVDFAATGDVATGQTAILANVGTFGGLSIQRESGFGSSSALRFKIKGQADGIVLRLESTTDGATDEREIPVTDAWTEWTISLDALAALGWDRIAWVDTTGLGATLRVDDIELLDDDPAAVAWRSAEPLGRSRVVLYGAGDPEAVTLRLDGQPLAVSGTVSESGPARVYFDLEEPLDAGVLEIETADGTFERSILDRALTVDDVVSHVIPPEVYGANFPDDPPNASAMARYRYGAVRWGGNARALYNPATRTTNVGEDFYYLNVFVNPALEEWSRLVDVPSVVTVPNLDWVANGTLGWSFSVDKYGPQESVAPINDDAGDGYDLDGNPITGNDPTDTCEVWTPADATAWLQTLETTPSILAIGNETDIAHITHRAVYPDPATYDDQLRHFLDYANAAKDALPTVPVSGPVGCCWFFYWNSGNPADATAYGDFLPWFLDEVAAADALSGRRTLDILDLHYYPENLIALDWKNQSTPAIDAWRLRSTRSLWDPEHIDESYVGEEPPVTDQPDADRVQLIPRMQQLIDDHYPGTQLMLSEWGFGDERGISGGLAAADALGIFGREEVDYAFMWPGPPTGSFAAAAFELYRGG